MTEIMMASMKEAPTDSYKYLWILKHFFLSKSEIEFISFKDKLAAAYVSKDN